MYIYLQGVLVVFCSCAFSVSYPYSIQLLLCFGLFFSRAMEPNSSSAASDHAVDSSGDSSGMLSETKTRDVEATLNLPHSHSGATSEPAKSSEEAAAAPAAASLRVAQPMSDGVAVLGSKSVVEEGGAASSGPGRPAAAVSSSSSRVSASVAPAPPLHPKLAFLESLSPADALRYKALAAAKPPLDMCLYMLGESLPLLEEAEREDLAIALSAATKAFAVQLCETAVDVRDAAGDAPDGVVRERHMLEAYGRIVRRGLLPGTPEWAGSAEATAMAGATAADVGEDAGQAGPTDVFEALLFGGAGPLGDAASAADKH